jgi:hypothetical protein
LGVLDKIKNIVSFGNQSNTADSQNSSINTTNIDPARTQHPVDVDDFAGTRITVPTQANAGGMTSLLPRIARTQLGLDTANLASYDVFQLIDILADAHPDLSFALWNFIRVCNSGYTISVHKLGSDKDFTQGQKIIQNFLDVLNVPCFDRFEKSRGLDKLLNYLIISLMTRGAGAFEMVMTPDKTDVSFIAPVDPKVVIFKYENNRFVPYERYGSLSLDIPTFFYEGLDEFIDDPYGRSPFLASLNMILFQLQVLNDIKAVVHNQGYPKFDIKIIEQVLLNRMPITIRNNEIKKQQWMNDRLNDIIMAYNNLEPDASFVHYDSVNVDMVGGGKGGGALIDPQKLMTAIDNLLMSGLKTLSTIMGRRSQGQTESYAKMEVKLYIKSVEAIQSVIELLLSRALTLYLNIKGKQGIAEFKFNPIDIRTDIEKAQFQQIALLNYAFMRDQGWITQDEASMLAVGHNSVGEPVSRVTTITNKDGNPVSSNPDTKPQS